MQVGSIGEENVNWSVGILVGSMGTKLDQFKKNL